MNALFKSDLSQSCFVVTHSDTNHADTNTLTSRVATKISMNTTQKKKKKKSFRFRLKRDTKQMIDLLVKLSWTEWIKNKKQRAFMTANLRVCITYKTSSLTDGLSVRTRANKHWIKLAMIEVSRSPMLANDSCLPSQLFLLLYGKTSLIAWKTQSDRKNLVRKLFFMRNKFLPLPKAFRVAVALTNCTYLLCGWHEFFIWMKINSENIKASYIM